MLDIQQKTEVKKQNDGLQMEYMRIVYHMAEDEAVCSNFMTHYEWPLFMGPLAVEDAEAQECAAWTNFRLVKAGAKLDDFVRNRGVYYVCRALQVSDGGAVVSAVCSGPGAGPVCVVSGHCALGPGVAVGAAVARGTRARQGTSMPSPGTASPTTPVVLPTRVLVNWERGASATVESGTVTEALSGLTLLLCSRCFVG